MIKPVILLLLLMIGHGVTQLHAQPRPGTATAPADGTAPLITDRPDQTESSRTVPRRALQIETGFIFERYSGNGYRLDNTGLATTLLRFGVLDNFELRLGTGYQLSTLKPVHPAADTTQQGLAPVSAGLKVLIADEQGPWPELSVMADLTLNQVATLDFRPTYNYSTIRFAASHTLTDRLGLGYNLGYANNGEDPKGFFLYSLALGISITETIGAFAESYGNFDPAGLPRHRFDAGITWRILPQLQADLSAGAGPADQGLSMWFVNTGLSWRIPR